jgi:hypothetical protein
MKRDNCSVISYNYSLKVWYLLRCFNYQIPRQMGGNQANLAFLSCRSLVASIQIFFFVFSDPINDCEFFLFTNWSCFWLSFTENISSNTTMFLCLSTVMNSVVFSFFIILCLFLSVLWTIVALIIVFFHEMCLVSLMYFF